MTTIDKNRAAGLMESIERGLDRMFADPSNRLRAMRLEIEAQQEEYLHLVRERNEQTLETLTLAATYLRSRSNY